MAEKMSTAELSGFGALKNAIADELTKEDVVKLATHFELSRAVIGQLEQPRDGLGLFLLDVLEQRGFITSQDLSSLVSALSSLELEGTAEKVAGLCVKHIGSVTVDKVSDTPKESTSVATSKRKKRSSAKVSDTPKESPSATTSKRNKRSSAKDSSDKEQTKRGTYRFLTGELFESYKENDEMLETLNSKQKEAFEKRMLMYDYGNETIMDSGNVGSQPIRIVMLGRTGSGKSATANTILGDCKFVEGNSAVSETMASCMATAKLPSGRKVTVVDTPGPLENKQNNEEIINEIARIAYLLRGGVHAFAIVRNAGEIRYARSDQEVLTTVKKDFGDDFMEHCFVVFSRADTVLKSCNLVDFIAGQRKHGEVRSFLDEMDPKFVAVENKTDIPAEKNRNQTVLIEMVDHIMHKTGCEVYTNDLFRKAEALHCKVQEEAQKNQWHPALVAAVIEVFDTYTSFALTGDVLHGTVLNLLEKSNTGSVNESTGVVTLRHETKEETMGSSDCREQVKSVFMHLLDSVKDLTESLMFEKFAILIIQALMAPELVPTFMSLLKQRLALREEHL